MLPAAVRPRLTSLGHDYCTAMSLKPRCHAYGCCISASSQVVRATPACAMKQYHIKASSRVVARVVSESDRDQRTTIDQITGSKSFASPECTSSRGPIVMAMDDTEEALDSLHFTLSCLCSPGADPIHVVHVVCDPLAMGYRTSVGQQSHVQMGDEVTVSRDMEGYAKRLLTAARTKLSQRCVPLLEASGMLHEIHMPPLSCPRSAAVIGSTLLNEANRLHARMLVVASHGPGALAEYGSVARYCYQHSPVPLVLIPPRKDIALAHQAKHTASSVALAAGAAGPRVGLAPMDPAKVDPSWQIWAEDDVVFEAAQATSASRDDRWADDEPMEVTMLGHVAEHGKDRDKVKARDEETPVVAPGVHTVFLVVAKLQELASHWQWLADNVLRHGDTLKILHLTSGLPTKPAEPGCSSSLPTALTQVLLARGLKDVIYEDRWFEQGPKEIAEYVRSIAQGPQTPRLICVLNYCRQSSIIESVLGSVASELAKASPAPLLLLQPEE